VAFRRRSDQGPPLSPQRRERRTRATARRQRVSPGSTCKQTGRTAFNTFSVPRGRVVGLVGHNGSGCGTDCISEPTNHIGLADRLAESDGHRMIRIRVLPLGCGDELVARDRPHRLKRCIAEPALPLQIANQGASRCDPVGGLDTIGHADQIGLAGPASPCQIRFDFPHRAQELKRWTRRRDGCLTSEVLGHCRVRADGAWRQIGTAFGDRLFGARPSTVVCSA